MLLLNIKFYIGEDLVPINESWEILHHKESAVVGMYIYISKLVKQNDSQQQLFSNTIKFHTLTASSIIVNKRKDTLEKYKLS